MTEETLFERAYQLPAAERSGFLDRECAGDPALRARVEALLAADAVPHSPLDAPAGPPMDATATFGDPAATSQDSAGNEAEGTVIAGRYKLGERIGEGGMGSVYLAHQSAPVKRKVAVKLIKAGMDSKAVLARFDAERQALAMMDHPSIAKVLDGGLHDGRPFFVMELVKGVPITEYCDKRKLTPKERLELFVPVCHAIQHAHQKGIIHRDIKPSNVLVALYDDRPVPKVIDFGVAKATGGSLTEHTIETAFGGVVGTPQYMSPEQASLNNLDIDTRSDVYSLGVLLYELLTGSPPFAPKELEKRGLLEILRVVREEEPPRPSTRLSTADALPSLSASRGTEPKKLTGLLRNELDWIVMKALEKDRTLRYETANGFAADVHRYLSGEAVQAHPPSTAYKVKKFVRRNRGQVIAASLVFLTLLAGIAGTTFGLFEAKRQEGFARMEAKAKDEALQAEAEERKKAEAAKVEAQAKEAEANAVVEFFENKVFAAARPEGQDGGLGKEVSLRDAIAASLPALGPGFTAQPLVEARLRMTLGNTFRHLAEYEQAREQDEQSRALYMRHCGPDHPFTLGSMNNLALSYVDLNRPAEALKLNEEVLEIQKRVLPKDHPSTLTSMTNLATTYAALNRPAEALKLREEVLEIQKRVLPKDHPITLKSMYNLAVSYLDLNRRAEALKLREEVVEIQKRVLPKEHPDTLKSMGGLANSYSELNRPADALKLNEEVLAIQKRVLPKEHPDTLGTMNNLAVSYSALNRPAEASKLREEVLEIRKRVLPKDHPATLTSMSNLALSYAVLNRPAEALKLNEEVLEIQQRVLPKDHPNTLTSMTNLANSYTDLNRHAEALKLRDEVLAIQKRLLPKDHPDTLRSMNSLAISYAALNRPAEALKLREELLEISKRVRPKDHPSTLSSMHNLAISYATLNRHAEALKLNEEVLEIRKRVLPSDHPDTLKSMMNLASSYGVLNRPAEALKLNEEVLEIQQRVLPKDHPHTLQSMHNLALSLIQLERGEEAIPLIDEFVVKAAGQAVPPGLIPGVMALRMRHFQKVGDPAGCRATVEMWEKLNRPDAGSLYNAACYRSVTATVQAKSETADAAQLAKEDADRAMEWLQKAVQAGFKDAAHMQQDTDLDPLREREDFQQLMAELENSTNEKE